MTTPLQWIKLRAMGFDAIILSKAFLLVDETRIGDPTILRQL